jgi:hypothetical protein
VYGIKQFGNSVIPLNEIKNPLKFEFKLFNIKGKSLPDNKVRKNNLYFNLYQALHFENSICE